MLSRSPALLLPAAPPPPKRGAARNSLLETTFLSAPVARFTSNASPPLSSRSQSESSLATYALPSPSCIRVEVPANGDVWIAPLNCKLGDVAARAGAGAVSAITRTTATPAATRSQRRGGVLPPDIPPSSPPLARGPD